MNTTMELRGEVTKVLPQVTGEGKNAPWKKREFLVRYGEKYPKEVCLAVWGDAIPENAEKLVGQTVEVSFDLESRENNGRYYTDAKAWKFKVV